MVKSIATRKMSGPAPLAQSKASSKERTARRHKVSVKGSLVRVVNRMMGLGAFAKVPCVQASDVLTLCLVTSAFLDLGFSFEAVTLVYLAAHSIRCPSLLRTLYDRAENKGLKLQCPSEVATWLRMELSSHPFKDQRGGLPFWIGLCQHHFGSRAALRYLTPECELKFFGASLHMLQLAKNQTTADVATKAIQALPGC